MINTLEQNARRAKEGMSFSDYKPGSATAEYNEYCAKAESVAEYAKEQLTKKGAPAERIERVDYLLNLYKSKKLSWMNDLYTNRARVPSVLIAGPANLPVRAMEKQNAREDSLMKQNPESILDEIRGIGHNAGTIYSDEENAVERIKAKIEALKDAPDPYGNKAAEMRRLKGRLLKLAPEEFAEQKAKTTVNDVNTYDGIVALWEAGRKHKSDLQPENPRWYFDLPLEFYNGSRHYKELLSIEVDEAGENLIKYNIEKRADDYIPLTDELKYKLIISKICGSGNKAVMYQHLKSLVPVTQKDTTEEPKEETATINGESAKIVRNKESMRLQLFFDGKPEKATRDALKSNGFRWAPSITAWQRLLNGNAESALRRISANV